MLDWSFYSVFPDIIIFSSGQSLLASSGWHEELQLEYLTEKECISSKLEVFKGFGELSLCSHIPEKALTQNFECRDVERPLDLSQVDSFKHTEIKPHFTKVSSPKVALSKSFAAPGSTSSLAVSSVGSAILYPRSSLFGSLASPKQLDPPNNEQGLKTDCCPGVSPEWGSLPRLPSHNPPFGSFTGSAFSGVLFSCRQSDLPTMNEGPELCPFTVSSLGLDSPPQQNPLFSFPRLPPPGPTGGSSFHLLPGSSPLHFPNSSAPLSTSYKQPMHQIGFAPYGAPPTCGASPLNISVRTASSDSLPHTYLTGLSSFETESDETPGFFASRLFKKVEKSDIARRDFPASFPVLNDGDDIDCKESWMNFVPGTELFSLQTEVLVLFHLYLLLICFIVENSTAQSSWSLNCI